MSATLRSHTEVYTTSSGTSLTANHTTQAGDRLLAFVGAMRNVEETNWGFTVTFDGQNGSLLAEVWQVSNNRSLLLRVYAFDAPSIGSNKVFRVQSGQSIQRFGAYICSYSGSTGFGAAGTAHVNENNEQTVSPNLSQAFSVVAVAGLTRATNSIPSWTFDSPAFLTDQLHTGTGSTSVNIGMALGHAAAVSTGPFGLTVSTTDVSETALIAVEILSETGFVASATVSAMAAPFLVPATAEGSTTEPTVLVGSIPPTQVLWQGNLFFSTKTRTVNVLFLTTNGDNWVQPNNGGAAQTVSAVIKRRRAYLIPQ